MPKTLTLHGPRGSRNYLNGTRHVEWYLLDEHGMGYLVSWLEEAYDTGRPECMAFVANMRPSGVIDVLNWQEKAVSYNPDAVIALDEVLEQLKDAHGYRILEYEYAVKLRPGEKDDPAIDLGKANNYAWRLVTGDWRGDGVSGGAAEHVGAAKHSVSTAASRLRARALRALLGD